LNSKLGEVDSKFRFIILAAKRTRQLQSGARPMIASASKKFTRVAMEELSQGKVEFEITEEELPKRKSRGRE
jgi:DNA-directed RNA polymerase subunit omega